MIKILTIVFAVFLFACSHTPKTIETPSNSEKTFTSRYYMLNVYRIDLSAIAEPYEEKKLNPSGAIDKTKEFIVFVN